jgi:SurA N-terminal domain
MFGTIRKHQTWLWAIIIAVTIISFVIFFSPSSRQGGQGRGTANYGSIDGERIGEEDFINAYREANLHFFMSYGSWPDADAKRLGFDPDRETYSRLFFIQKLKQHNIKVDSASVARTANAILASLGRGNPVPLDAFMQQVLAPHGLSADDFERYIRHDLGIQQLVSVLGVTGKLVTPAEAQAVYIRERQELSASAVFFAASNFLASVSAPTPEAVAQFYTNQMSAYRIPDRMQVSYVKFDVTNFMADADQQIAKLTNFSAMVDQIYRQRGTNFYKETLTADEAKTRIRAEMRHELATVAARKKANDFASDLFDLKPQRPENLAALAQSNGLTAKISPPFANDFPPDEIGPVKGFLIAAFALTAEEPFAGPLTGAESVYVISLDKNIPSEIPPLEKIHSQVEADFKYTQALMLARRAGAQFGTTLTNGLAQGKTFAGICTDAKVKSTLIPPFSLSTRELPEGVEQITVDQLKPIVFDTPVGKSSGFVPTREGGLVVFVQQRLPIDDATMRADMPAFINSVRQARQNEAINFWYRRETERDPGIRAILQELAKRDQRTGGKQF